MKDYLAKFIEFWFFVGFRWQSFRNFVATATTLWRFYTFGATRTTGSRLLGRFRLWGRLRLRCYLTRPSRLTLLLLIASQGRILLVLHAVFVPLPEYFGKQYQARH